MSTEPTTDQTALRPVSGDPDVHHGYADDDWDLETPIDPRVGWDLSWGCKLTFGYDDEVLHVTVSTSDRDQRDGITKRAVTREQLADYARKLASLVGVEASEVDRLRAELADARAEIASRRMHDEATTHHLNVALWLHAEALEEIAKLQQALSVAERHDADIRFEAEADVRAELAAKAGA